MFNEEFSQSLSNISEEIFTENLDEQDNDVITIDWEINKNIGCPTTFNSSQEITDLISSIKGKLDIISQNFSNEVNSPQLEYLKGMVTTELMAISSNLDNNIHSIGNAIDLQQNINMNNGTSTIPVLISMPLN